MPHWLTVVATVAAQLQKPTGSVADAGRPYNASSTLTPSACACGAARTKNGSSSIVVGRSGLHESVHRSSLMFAPFSIVSNHLPPSSAYLPVSSATPKVIGPAGAAVPRVLFCAPAVPARAISAHANAHARTNVFM